MIDRELTARELKIKREIKYLNPIIVSIVDMDKLEQKKKKKIKPIKNTWYDLLINFIPEPLRESVGGFSLFKTNKPKKAVYGRGKKLSKPKIQNIRNNFILKK